VECYLFPHWSVLDRREHPGRVRQDGRSSHWRRSPAGSGPDPSLPSSSEWMWHIKTGQLIQGYDISKSFYNTSKALITKKNSLYGHRKVPRFNNCVVIKYNIKHRHLDYSQHKDFIYMTNDVIYKSPLILQHINEYDSEVPAAYFKKSTVHYLIVCR
jgi:hypothetical protein